MLNSYKECTDMQHHNFMGYKNNKGNVQLMSRYYYVVKCVVIWGVICTSTEIMLFDNYGALNLLTPCDHLTSKHYITLH